MRNIHVTILAFLLALAGTLLCYYKVQELHLPLTQENRSSVWTVEARITYKPTRGSAKLNLTLPNHPPGLEILDEDFISGGYGLDIEEHKNKRIAEWTLRRPKGLQALYYRIQLIPNDWTTDDPQPVFPKKKKYSEMVQTAVNTLLDEVRSKSADTKSFTHELLVKLNSKNPTDTIKLLRKNARKTDLWVNRIIEILQGARIPARQVNILKLKDGLTRGKLTPWLEVHNGKKWLSFDPISGKQGYPKNVLIWSVGNSKIVTVEGGKKLKIAFSVYQQFQDSSMIALQKAKENHSWAMEFSLFNLPVQTQNVYRTLLMIPIGCVLMVLFRNVIGIKCIGTFMPILIALAFRETELLWGIFLFSLIIGLGLLLRFYLEYLHLLLVPRLGAVLIIVILLMLLMSLVSHKLGIEGGLSIALFPMVIMAMTIERMSLIWEEQGPGEALLQGVGTLFLAACGYLLMNNEFLQHLFFVFPELLLVLLAFTLLLGRYTGYRLSELWRFRALLK